MENQENLLYLLSACLLIIGLKMLGSPKTAVRGNAIGAVGMLIAAAVALLLTRDGNNSITISRGALIAIGLFTRPAAFVASGLMAVAYWMAHAPNHLFPLVNGGELASLYCFVFLYISARGGGNYSIDDTR